MMTASDAVLTAAGFLGLHTARLDPAPSRADADPAFEGDAAPSADLLSRGEPCFEAVEAALRGCGYLEP